MCYRKAILASSLVALLLVLQEKRRQFFCSFGKCSSCRNAQPLRAVEAPQPSILMADMGPSQPATLLISRADAGDLRSIASLRAREPEACPPRARTAELSRQGLYLRELEKLACGTAALFATIESSEPLNVEDLQEFSNLKEMLDARFMSQEMFDQSVQSLQERYSDVTIRRTVGAVDVDDIRGVTESIQHHSMSAFKNSCYISNFLVDSKYRRRGIGSRLLKAVTRYAHEKGFGAMILSVEGNNQSALRLYEKNGFREVDDAGVYSSLRRIFQARFAVPISSLVFVKSVSKEEATSCYNQQQSLKPG
ncbi:hypothetical protein GUITHDRAFT_99255 [Guillardia theta CCMP2712]|uniref:N-acetyltransferase domain-containing protein n=1 Tax=Guillardia theta (strain CCMP2712) TaxID=905079 RepID=L1K539_GUITC|nr:hypothetical protein GUITHDRAFT_99255 [Guillardia theta CCMP2712]EKX55478.1 hypothetical protein GUITHDRAFT_99255 [Guillardia theta CCMP2712]|mmetsp:Transcript_26626/g.87381  ORF Transcript_26626/g.87381 Transcript_26626/m.87381 type:complete len:308 (-) Transcript_26626:210-1133(-)|eukprot:XP_005842458.1 hypothetical protein GUITHDRAFT_99255 [Guillardia theta CCMP2712]